jgi:hypothetical protein
LSAKVLNKLFLGAFLLATLFVFTPISFAQSSNQAPGIAEEGGLVDASEEDNKEVLEKSPLGLIPDGPDACDLKFPYIAMPQNKDPYVENGPEICKNSEIRGKRLQCEIDTLAMDKSGGPTTTGAKIEFASWARCNSKVATLLIAGYYIPSSEIERRLQLCSANFYADPGEPAKLGWYQRLIKWYYSNDLTPPISDSVLDISIRQSLPIESQQDMAGLMKCEWMFSRSKTPYIDPLPNLNRGDGASRSK